MYLSATMTIDPSELVHLRRKPTKGFRRFAEILTGNLLSQKEVHETFTALSILQEINVVLRSVGVTDVVRFIKDDRVLYDDQDSTSTDDMSSAIDALSRSGLSYQTHSQDGSFSKLALLLEHHLATIALIIEIKILRVHEIGVYPIQISVNGLDTELQSEGPRSLSERLEEVFVTQQSYEEYVERKRTEFEGFMEQLKQAFHGKMRIDNLNCRVYTNIVRPGLAPSQGSGTQEAAGSDSQADTQRPPMLQRYESGADPLIYMWMWSSFMHSHNTHCRDSTIVSEAGQPVFSVGAEGFDAGSGSTLDPEAPFEPPDCDIQPVESVDGEIFENQGFDLLGQDVSQPTSSSWFDSFAFGGDVGDSSGADFGGDGGASCGSSCGGGGCGGGCGS